MTEAIESPQPGNPFLLSAQAGKNSLWRYLVTVALIVSAVLLFAIPVVLIYLALGGPLDVSKMPPMASFLTNMSIFPAGLAALWIGVTLLHRRRFMSLITPKPSIAWHPLLLSALIWFGLSALGDLVMALFVTPGNYKWSFQLNNFIIFAILSFIFIPIQSSTEELVFRGYLMQGFSLLAKRPWIPLVLSSAIFALLHSSNPEVASYGLDIMLVYYFSMGLLLGWITLQTAGLEAALGIHAANNIYASLFVTFPSSALQTPALFTMTSFNAVLSLVVFYITAIIYLYLYRVLSQYMQP
jgi:membrane protease YdiL (CAAX protease family)